jgi:hypothetical protein
MNTPSEESTIHEQVTRLAELEQENSSLHEELTNARAERAPATEEEGRAKPQTRTRPRRSSRRKMLTKGLGVAAVASVGAGALLELSSGRASASSIKPGVFASSTAGTPAVKATGTNGAHGVDATSDSGTGVSATSGSGTGLLATSSSGIGLHAVGGGASPGTPPNGVTEVAVFAEGGPNPALIATGSSGNGVFAQSSSGVGVVGLSQSGDGVFGSSFSNIGVAGLSSSGPGVVGSSDSSDGVRGSSSSTTVSVASVHGINTNGTSSGLAGLFEGNVQVNGNFSATGTKNFVQAHPTDPGREIVYVALEGGEAGTYVRGSGQLQGGKAVLALPEHFGLVTATEGLTIQLTPRGEWLQLYAVELDTAQLIVREAQGKSGIFDYFICGVRRGYEQHEVLRTKR